MGNWTKGPWAMEKSGSIVAPSVADDINADYGVAYMVDGKASKANAQLISAAPDMAGAIDGSLQCLRLISNMLERDGGVRAEVKQELDEHIGNMMEALSKAKGE